MVEYAGFWVRLVADVIDTFVIFALSFLVGFLLVFLGGLPDQFILAFESSRFTVVSIIVVLLYESHMTSSPKQATLGKLALGVKVTDLEGKRISFGAALGRAVVKELPFRLMFPQAPILLFVSSLFIVLLSILMLAFDSRKQALHDRLVGTLVVEARSRLPNVPGHSAGISA